MLDKNGSKRFIHDVINDFDIAWPVFIKFKKGMGQQALYENKVDDYGTAYHKITLSKDHGITEETCLHELVHAWQCENGKKVGHGKSFDKWRKICNDWGYGEIL